MSKSKHTPGKYEVILYKKWNRHEVWAKDGTLDYQVAICGGRWQKGNANLFAAAPDTAAERDRLKAENKGLRANVEILKTVRSEVLDDIKACHVGVTCLEIKISRLKAENVELRKALGYIAEDNEWWLSALPETEPVQCIHCGKAAERAKPGEIWECDHDDICLVVKVADLLVAHQPTLNEKVKSWSRE